MKGKLVRHTPEEPIISSGEIAMLLYVDDGAVGFLNRADMIRGINILHAQMARLGLVMHLGRDDAKSKT